MFGELPAWAFYIRHAEGITFQNVSFQAANKDFRPAFVIDDAENIQLNRTVITPANDSPVVVLNAVKGFNVTESTPPAGAKEFVRELSK